MGQSTGLFQNPIVASGQDPWVIYHDHQYHLIESFNADVTGLTIRSSINLTDVGTAQPQTVWQTPLETMQSKQLWAPELHLLDGRWYIYYAAADDDNVNHRMYVLGSQTDSLYGPYEYLGKLFDPNEDFWAIDATVFYHDNQLYCVWSGWPSFHALFPQNLYIAPMETPWTLAGPRVLIATPEYDWESTVAALNEAPQILRNSAGQIFIIYSADASWGPQKLGLLSHTGGSLLDPNSWQKTPMPIFEEGSTGVYGPGHPSFVKSADGTEDWMVYHAKKSEELSWDRDIRTQQFTWKDDGTPFFGHPITADKLLKRPSGESLISSDQRLMIDLSKTTVEDTSSNKSAKKGSKMSTGRVTNAIYDSIARIIGRVGPSVKPPHEIEKSLQAFRRDYPESKQTAFIIMSFKDDKPNQAIQTAIQDALKKQKIVGLRADAKEYHHNLYYNILTYIYGCTFGIAVFDRIVSDKFNPNVIFEVGYSFAIGKKVCLLKDKTLENLPTDMLGTLYKPFDTHDAAGTIPREIKKWVDDHNDKVNVRWLQLGDRHQERLDPNELDFYVVKINAGQRFSIEGQAQTNGTRMALYNSVGQEQPVAPTNGIFNRFYVGDKYYGGIWNIEAKKDETYIICVSGGVGEYEITATDGPHGVSVGAIAVGQSRINTLKQREFHRWILDLTNNVNQQIVIELDTKTRLTWLELFDVDSMLVERASAAIAPSNSCEAKITYDVQFPGKYMLSILNSEGTYTLKVRVV